MNLKLEKILDEDKANIKIGGKFYQINPLRTRNLPRAMKCIESLKDLKQKSMIAFITENFDNAIEFISAASLIEPKVLMDSEISELVEVIEKVMELNKDTFFLIQSKIEKWTGKKSSNTSLKKGTASTT